MRTLLLFALLPIIACSDDDKPTAPTPTLNTTPRIETDRYFYIKQWDGSNWVATTSQVNLQTNWRFTSYDGITSGVDNGGTISGGYTIEFTNTSNKLVDGRISKIRQTIDVHVERPRRKCLDVSRARVLARRRPKPGNPRRFV